MAGMISASHPERQAIKNNTRRIEKKGPLARPF
jgi:hypothetical protein